MPDRYASIIYDRCVEEAVIGRCINEYYNLNTIGLYKDYHVGVRPLDETQKTEAP